MSINNYNDLKKGQRFIYEYIVNELPQVGQMSFDDYDQFVIFVNSVNVSKKHYINAKAEHARQSQLPSYLLTSNLSIEESKATVESLVKVKQIEATLIKKTRDISDKYKAEMAAAEKERDASLGIYTISDAVFICSLKEDNLPMAEAIKLNKVIAGLKDAEKSEQNLARTKFLDDYKSRLLEQYINGKFVREQFVPSNK
jgi:hypothetical protein